MPPNPEQQAVVAFCSQFDAFVLPVESYVADPGRNVHFLPVHLEAIQESFDILAPMAYVLPSSIYDAASGSLRLLMSQLEQLQGGRGDREFGQTWQQNSRGHWGKAVDQDTLLKLCELRISDARIAALFECSPSAVKRRRTELGVLKRKRALIWMNSARPLKPFVTWARAKLASAASRGHWFRSESTSAELGYEKQFACLIHFLWHLIGGRLSSGAHTTFHS
ncbi:hypothetical protein A4X13_0g5296 [Tilletia indica]|uniref:Uncharacterized protein n=1 Tax=Tilletia indica TaxID=43049 RepID=A0A177TP50_9BASI|nr:hypothetical protein A4X13_0g5296 [Tilletia indica]